MIILRMRSGVSHVLAVDPNDDEWVETFEGIDLLMQSESPRGTFTFETDAKREITIRISEIESFEVEREEA